MWIINDYLFPIIDWCDKHGVDDIVNVAADTVGNLALVVTAGIAASAISAVAGLFITPGPDPTDLIVALIGGAIASSVTYYVLKEGELDLGVLVGFINDNKTQMICALSNSQNAWSAHSALMAAIDNASPTLDPGNRNLISNLFGGNPALGLLFYIDSRYQVLEAYIAKQPDTCPCADDDPQTNTQEDVYHCKAVNYLFDGFVDTLDNWSTVATMTWYTTPSFITALTGGLLWTLLGGIYNLVFVGITAVAAFIAKIVSFLGTLYWSGADYFTAFELIAAQFSANKEAIICELYEAADIDEAKAALEGHLDDYLGTVMTAHPEWAEQQDTYKDVIMALLSNTVLNVLFEEAERTEITNYNPEGFTDCAECGMVQGDLGHYVDAYVHGGYFQCPLFARDEPIASYIGPAGVSYVVFGLDHRMRIQFSLNGWTYIDDVWHTPNFRLGSTCQSFNTEDDDYSGNVNPGEVECCNATIISSTPFTLTVISAYDA